MLIVPNEAAVRVRGEGRLASSTQTEEECHIVWVLRVDVRRAVHRKHTFKRKQVIQNREDRFLDLARISCVADNGKFLLKRKTNKGFAICAVHCWCAFERWHGDDRKLWHESFVFFERLRQDKHIAHKMTMPRQLRHNADGQTVSFICSRINVLYEDIASLQETQHAVIKDFEFGCLKWTVVHTPPNVIFRVCVTHHKFIVSAASCMLARVRHIRAASHNSTFVAEGRFFD